MGGEGHSDGEEHGEGVEEREEKPLWQLFKMTTLYGCSTLLLVQPCFDLAFAIPEDGQQAQHPALPPEAASVSFQHTSKHVEKRAWKMQDGHTWKGRDTKNSNRASALVLPDLLQSLLTSKGAFLDGSEQVWDHSLPTPVISKCKNGWSSRTITQLPVQQVGRQL